MPMDNPSRVSLKKAPKETITRELKELQEKHQTALERRDYADAERLHKLIEKEKTKLQAKRVHQEFGRQGSELLLIEQTGKNQMQKAESVWQDRGRELEQLLERRLARMREKQEVEMATMKKSLSSQPQMSIKYSPGLIRLMDSEKKLARIHKYVEAKNVAAQVDRQRAQEEAEHAAKVERFMRKRVRTMSEKHLAERELLQKKNDNFRSRFELEKQNDLKRIATSIDIQMKNAKHAFTLEITHDKLHRVEGNKSPSRRSYETHSASFRGTQMSESGKVDVELVGPSAVLKAARASLK
eukprot:gnl/Chilomastix_cuspidata/54.p1 GENE.gnl/Chilomastix_cuspidata/54~~gnl/Chilomastix_cuspidata/54.p1  ORF type:complete len:298 (+),score=112.41 gnl/Chilomastix_cuspidata/54:564-1457(+)